MFKDPLCGSVKFVNGISDVCCDEILLSFTCQALPKGALNFVDKNDRQFDRQKSLKNLKFHS